MTPDTIAILEDDPRRTRVMRRLLARHFPGLRVEVRDNAPDLIEWLWGHLPTVCLIALDHDLGPDRECGGRRVDPGGRWCRYSRE